MLFGGRTRGVGDGDRGWLEEKEATGEERE